MNTNILTQQHLLGTRALAGAYTEILMDAAKAAPSFSCVAFTLSEEEPPVPLHRGTFHACEVLSRTANDDSPAALLQCLRELYECPWLTPGHVQGLLALAARSEDLTVPEAQARGISISADASPSLKAYGCQITLQRDWWVIRTMAGQECYRCLQLTSALRHAHLIKLTTPTHRKHPFNP